MVRTYASLITKKSTRIPIGKIKKKKKTRRSPTRRWRL